MLGHEKMFSSNQQFVALILTKCQPGYRGIALSNNNAMKYLEYLSQVRSQIGEAQELCPITRAVFLTKIFSLAAITEIVIFIWSTIVVTESQQTVRDTGQVPRVRWDGIDVTKWTWTPGPGESSPIMRSVSSRRGQRQRLLLFLLKSRKGPLMTTFPESFQPVTESFSIN